MNKDEILSATDEQLNQWAAEKVMGWEKYHHEEAKRGKRYNSKMVYVTDNHGRTDFNENPNYFLENEGWEFGLKHDFWSATWGEWRPATDIEQAIGLLEYLRNIHIQLTCEVIIGRMVGGGARSGCHIYQYGKRLAYRDSLLLPRAITIAALLAVVSMEEG